MNSTLGLLLFFLTLLFKIPLTILVHVKFLFHKNERTPPTLSQRLLCVASRTSQIYLSIPMIRKFVGTGSKQLEKQKYWIKKLDVSNEHDGWEGYLIADDAKQLEVGENADRIVLYAHGGAFVAGDALGTLNMFTDWIKTWKSTHGTNTQILSVEYQLAPEYPFPASRDNLLACYNWLVTKKKIDTYKIVFAGDTSGGNLVVTSALYLINNPSIYSIDPPAALILMSPALSLTFDAQSFIDNDSYDIMYLPSVKRCINTYIGDTNLSPSSPLVSPLFEDKVSGLPKVFACVGSYEGLLDDIKAFIDKLIKNNVTAELVVEDANLHGYAIYKHYSRNGGYENTIRHIGNFLYNEMV